MARSARRRTALPCGCYRKGPYSEKPWDTLTLSRWSVKRQFLPRVGHLALYSLGFWGGWHSPTGCHFSQRLMLQRPLRALVSHEGLVAGHSAINGPSRPSRSMTRQAPHDQAPEYIEQTPYSRSESSGPQSRTGWHQIEPSLGGALRTPCCNRERSSIYASRLSPITFTAHVKPPCTPHRWVTELTDGKMTSCYPPTPTLWEGSSMQHVSALSANPTDQSTQRHRSIIRPQTSPA